MGFLKKVKKVFHRRRKPPGGNKNGGKSGKSTPKSRPAESPARPAAKSPATGRLPFRTAFVDPALQRRTSAMVAPGRFGLPYSGSGRFSGSMTPGFTGRSSGMSGFSTPRYSGMSGISGMSGLSPMSSLRSVSTASSGSSSGGMGRSKNAYYVHIPSEKPAVVTSLPINLPAGAMVAQVGDVIAYHTKDRGTMYHWLGKVLQLTKSGVIVRQRGDFDNKLNFDGESLSIPREYRDVLVHKFKRLSPQNVPAFESAGYRFSYKNSASENGRPSTRSLTKGLQSGQYIAFTYNDKPVYGKIKQIDMKTGEIHMETSPSATYDNNSMGGIMIPLQGSQVQIKFKPTSPSNFRSIGMTLPKKLKNTYQQQGWQNLSQGFKSNTNSMKINYINKQLLGDKYYNKILQLFGDINAIAVMPHGQQRDDAFKHFLLSRYPDMEQIEEAIKKPLVARITNSQQRILSQQYEDLKKFIKERFINEDKDFDETMQTTKAAYKELQGSGWWGYLMKAAKVASGHAVRASAAVGAGYLASWLIS